MSTGVALLKILAKFVAMIPVSIGESLTEYLRIWAKQNNVLAEGIVDINGFFQWDKELKINLSKAHKFYYQKFIFPNQERYCDLMSEKLREPIGLFLENADFTTITLHITFVYVGLHWGRNITVAPTWIYPKMKVRR